MPAAKMHIHPNRVELVSGSGCSFVTFGGMFALVGLFMLLFVTRSAEHAAHHSILERVGAGGIGLAFMLAGMLFAFSKNGIVIDRSDAVINKWNGLSLFRFVTDAIPFSDLSRFALEQQGTHTYSVIVQGGTTTLTLLTSHSYATAREHADKIGSILPLELHDEVESS
jgi:hypothetical protein